MKLSSARSRLACGVGPAVFAVATLLHGMVPAAAASAPAVQTSQLHTSTVEQQDNANNNANNNEAVRGPNVYHDYVGTQPSEPTRTIADDPVRGPSIYHGYGGTGSAGTTTSSPVSGTSSTGTSSTGTGSGSTGTGSTGTGTGSTG